MQIYGVRLVQTGELIIFIIYRMVKQRAGKEPELKTMQGTTVYNGVDYSAVL